MTAGCTFVIGSESDSATQGKTRNREPICKHSRRQRWRTMFRFERSDYFGDAGLTFP
jgi:hypothetical protein